MSASVIQNKSDAFAVRIVNAYKYLREIKREFRMSDQLYRSGTSVQANVAEAQYAESHDDFIHKMSVALKEANEARSWINLLFKSGYFDRRTYDSIFKDVNEIIIILISIIRTAKRKKLMD